MPLEDWIQHSRVNQFLYDWQNLIAGVLAGFLALLAAWGTIWTTIRSANREIAASQAQTAVAQKQIDTTLRLKRRRAASEGFAFHTMLLAAMKRVLEEAKEAKGLVESGPKNKPAYESAYEARTHISKLGYLELRAACVRYGGRLTEEFLELETKIDNFASKTELLGGYRSVATPAGLANELTDIATTAVHLREEAVAAMEKANAVIAETEAEPLVPTPTPKRPWWRRRGG